MGNSVGIGIVKSYLVAQRIFCSVCSQRLVMGGQEQRERRQVHDVDIDYTGRSKGMMHSIIEWSMRFRLLVIALAVTTMVVGINQLRSMPVDALPEFAPPYV